VVQLVYVISNITGIMIPSDIEKGIQRYLAKTASEQELKELEYWLQDPYNKESFNDYVLLHHAINMGLNKVDNQPIKNRLLGKIRKKKSGIYRLQPRMLLKLVAVVFLLLGFGYFFEQKFNETNVEELIDANQITLQLDNGNIEVISEDGKRKIIDAEGNEVGVQKGNTLNYNEGVDSEKLIHNQLNIPNGKQFELVLSDGSSVFLIQDLP